METELPTVARPVELILIPTLKCSPNEAADPILAKEVSERLLPNSARSRTESLSFNTEVPNTLKELPSLTKDRTDKLLDEEVVAIEEI